MMTSSPQIMTRFRTLNLGFAVAGIILLILATTSWVEKSINIGATVISSSPNQWTFDISHLKPGLYFVSVGKTQTPCTINLTGSSAPTQSQDLSGYSSSRSYIYLGTTLEIKTADLSRQLELTCSTSPYLRNVLFQDLLIAPNLLGRTVHLWKAFLESILGPLAASFLLLSIIAISLFGSSESQLNSSLRVIGSSAFIFLYSLSLAYFPRLLFSTDLAAILHMFLRVAFSASIFDLFPLPRRFKRVSLIIHSLVLATMGIFLLVQPVHLANFYAILVFYFFPTIAAVSAVIVVIKLPDTHLNQILAAGAVSWSILQFQSSYVFLRGAGTYSNSLALGSIVGLLGYIKIKMWLEKENQFSSELSQRLAFQRILDFKQKQFELARKVAHDIRSPLAALEVVAFDSGLNDQTKKLIAKLTTRLHEIANELLRSKIEAGVQSEPILEIQEIIEEKKQTLAKANRLITFRIRNFQTAERINTRLTSTEFKQIFSNLLDNSIEAIDQRGTIEVQIQKATNELIRIQISDTGKGIPADVLPRLFNKGATHGKTGGNGLGLFQAKAALEKVGGSISIESRLGQGTQVSLSIPILN